MNDHYRILEISSNASHEVVLAAYRCLAVKNKDNEAMMKKLNLAKEILGDEDKRLKYDNDSAPKKGKIIGNYRILEVIAEGGFGRTYLGEHTILGTPVCIKHAHRISSEDELILHEEAKSIWDLRHYGIPNIRDIIKLADGSMALVMSHIPGPTLAQFVEKHGRLEAEHVAWITERVLNILKYIHFHGVIHGDVKPQNIIVQPESHTVVLVDYGLSAIRPRKDTNSKGYTPFFAAPEQMKGGTILPESDFYGLGVTMIYALGGNIESKHVPSDAPNHLCLFIKNLIKHDILARPSWDKKDLIEVLQEARHNDFGRKYSGMKPLKF